MHIIFWLFYKDLETAKREIIKLRQIAKDFQNQLRDEIKGGAAAAAKAKGNKREAVMDRAEQVKGSHNYVPKVRAHTAFSFVLILSKNYF